MKPTIATAALLALALAGCQREDPNNFAIDEGNSLNAEIETLPADESSLNNVAAAEANAAMPVPPAPVPPDQAQGATIPAQYHGRWGLVAADCTSTRGDAKGLITIGQTTVRFFEAVATLKEQRPAIATSFSGLFSFTGEGQNWEKVMTFTRTGDRLKRAEEAGEFTYTRCR
jgi:outer membrane murein-binding lipoprotein Lpp